MAQNRAAWRDEDQFMTEPLFREDAYLREAEAIVEAADPSGVILDRTIFYPQGGGQPGDRGELVLDDASSSSTRRTARIATRSFMRSRKVRPSPRRARACLLKSIGICASNGCAPIRRCIC
jgi:alanyl-tRNA synthetase